MHMCTSHGPKAWHPCVHYSSVNHIHPPPPQTPYKVEMESSQPHTPPTHGVDLWVFQMGLGWVSCGCDVGCQGIALGGGGGLWSGFDMMWI